MKPQIRLSSSRYVLHLPVKKRIDLFRTAVILKEHGEQIFVDENIPNCIFLRTKKGCFSLFATGAMTYVGKDSQAEILTFVSRKLGKNALFFVE